MAQEVSIQELSEALNENVLVLDVREGWEFQDGHVPNALHMPLSEVSERLEELSKEQKIWVICQSGGRSMTAAKYLETQGFDAVSVATGTGGWIAAGKTVSLEE